MSPQNFNAPPNEHERQHTLSLLKNQANVMTQQLAPIIIRRDLAANLAVEARGNGMISSSKFGVALIAYLDNEAIYHNNNVAALEINLKNTHELIAQLERMVISVGPGPVSGLNLGRKP